jgi:hypothetical protein
MQHEIVTKGPLLSKNGHLIQKGWSRTQQLHYNRENIGVGWHRIKEWDYYAIINPKFGITFTVADLGFLSLVSIVWLDFEKQEFTTGDQFKLFSRGKTNLPSNSSEGDISIDTNKVKLSITRTTDTRVIEINFPKFNKDKSITGKLTLFQDPNMDSIVIATPFTKNQKAFYYNQKVNCMPVEGIITINDETYDFKSQDSFGVLDWGRGVWTYKNTWYWGSASGLVNGIPFGFNIGYGFGDTSEATENIVFYNLKGHKLDEVEFILDDKEYLQPWKFTSSDGRFEMDFEPIVDRNATVNLLIFKSEQHQVFGYFSGYVILDDGEKIKVDRLLGFAEKVYNRW